VSGYSRPRPIRETDEIATFECGEPSLDEYLRKRALANHVAGGSRCFVTCREGRVVGCYAHFDFEPSPTDPLHLLLVKDARAALRLSGA
jgi:hypothetical protein